MNWYAALCARPVREVGPNSAIRPAITIAVVSQAGDVDLASATAQKAFQATSDIDDSSLRASALATLLSDLRPIFEENHKLTSRALESLLLSSVFRDHLAALPVPLLRQLLTYGYLYS